MAVSPETRTHLLDLLNRVRPVTARGMFGGLGLYSEGCFFALADDGVLYFKVDDTNRPDFEAAGMGPFRPYGDHRAMGYFEVPPEVLEDEAALGAWMDRALTVARRARAGKAPSSRKPRR